MDSLIVGAALIANGLGALVLNATTQGSDREECFHAKAKPQREEKKIFSLWKQEISRLKSLALWSS